MTSTPRPLRLPTTLGLWMIGPSVATGRGRALERLTGEAQGALHAVAVAGVAGDDDVGLAGADVTELGATLRLFVVGAPSPAPAPAGPRQSRA